MFELSEKFFYDLGFDNMTSTFWEKSMIEKPSDREVVCHASAEEFFFGPGTDTNFREDWRLVIATQTVIGCPKISFHLFLFFLSFGKQHQNVYDSHARRFRYGPPRNGAYPIFHELPQSTLGFPQRC